MRDEITRSLTDTYGAAYLLAFAAIGWVVLAALIQHASKNTKESKPVSTLGAMAVAGVAVGVVLLFMAANATS
ncbi:hypothetical protein [Nonomuraea sp. NPDC050310]|uniref:hypothetical protein n=1 Tax=Nonomuraea sp. NPDC050310 TaxID=3154935 RepID=UPI0033FFF070